MIMALAQKNGIDLPYDSLSDLRSRYEFTSLQSFLDLFYANMVVLRTAQDFTDLTVAYLERAADCGVRHIELFFDPQAHTTRGLTLSEVISGIRAGLAVGQSRFGISHQLIACFWRHAPVSEAMELLGELVREGHDIDGIGLDSSEVGFPPELFTEVFAYAREHDLHVVAHAGEEAGPEYIWQALDLLKVQRVDHGIRCLDDPELVNRLVAEQMPLTVCPLSNVRLRAVDTIADHPLPKMLEEGLNVSIHSDDPAYFGGYINANLKAVVEEFGLDLDTQALLARNSFQATFLTPSAKQSLVAEVDEWLATHKKQNS